VWKSNGIGAYYFEFINNVWTQTFVSNQHECLSYDIQSNYYPQPGNSTWMFNGFGMAVGFMAMEFYRRTIWSKFLQFASHHFINKVNIYFWTMHNWIGWQQVLKTYGTPKHYLTIEWDCRWYVWYKRVSGIPKINEVRKIHVISKDLSQVYQCGTIYKRCQWTSMLLQQILSRDNGELLMYIKKRNSFNSVPWLGFDVAWQTFRWFRCSNACSR